MPADAEEVLGSRAKPSIPDVGYRFGVKAEAVSTGQPLVE